MNAGRFILPALGLVLFGVLLIYSVHAELRLMDANFVTGYVLLLTMLGIFLLRGRKILSMIPLGRAALWVKFHVVAGFVAIGLFWVHIGKVWPTGSYEQVLAFLFYLVSLSGIVGYVIQKAYPRRLTQTGREIVYERIPAAVAELRLAASSLVIECAEKTGSDTLAKYHRETLDYFFQRPRFVLNHILGGARGAHWSQYHCATVGRYLSDSERPYLEKLSELLSAKVTADIHYAGQSVMKMWLWFHVPIASALIVLSLWHFLLINIYAS